MNPPAVRASLRVIPVRGLLCLCLFILSVWNGFSPQVLSAQESAAKRKLLQRTAAPYPALARNMALEGIAKVEALVVPDGSVRTVNIKGGHPVLAQAAANAVRNWRWEPAAHESHEMVEVKFSPE